MPVRWLLKDRFEAAARIAGAGAPVLIGHGEADGIVPIQYGKALFEAARKPEEAAWIRNGEVPDSSACVMIAASAPSTSILMTSALGSSPGCSTGTRICSPLPIASLPKVPASSSTKPAWPSPTPRKKRASSELPDG